VAIAAYALLHQIVIMLGNLVHQQDLVLVMERMPYARGAFVSVQGALAFLVYPSGSTAELTRCNIVSVHVVDLMEGR